MAASDRQKRLIAALTWEARSIDVRRVRLNHGLPSCLALILFCSLWQGVDFFDTLRLPNGSLLL
jgi:hypothetical protein